MTMDVLSFLSKYSIHMDSRHFPVLTECRRKQKTTEIEIIMLGDSHGWGQGSPGYDVILPYYWPHMAPPHNKGFFSRLQKYIFSKYQFYPKMIHPYGNEQLMTHTAEIQPLFGEYTKVSHPLEHPLAAGGFYCSYDDQMRAHLGYLASSNKFSEDLLIVAPERSQRMSSQSSLTDYLVITPNPRYRLGEEFSEYTHNKGLYYAFNQDMSLHLIHSAEAGLPDWVKAGTALYIPGYGEVFVDSLRAPELSTIGGVDIFLRKADGSLLMDDISGFLYPGVRLYQPRVGRALFYIDMLAYASKVYIGVLSGEFGARLEIYYGDEQTKSNASDSRNYKYPLADGFPKISKLVNGKHEAVSSSIADVSLVTKVTIDTYKAGQEEEIVYCIDYGQKRKGRLFYEYAGVRNDTFAISESNSAHNSSVLKLRGIVFDSNDVRNFSMGGHTVGQWLGDGTPSFNDSSYAHLDELLGSVPFTPTLVIIQVPVVNEYIRQTAIESFKANLHALIYKLNQHYNSEGGRKMDVLMFTSLGDKLITFQGGASAPISYPDYYHAVKEFCLLQDYGFVNFEEYFRDCVASGILDYEFLFDDSIHPSPYVNEFIAQMLGDIIDLIM